MIKTRDKIFLEILAISFVLLMAVSCAAPSIAVDDPSLDDTLNPLNGVFPSEKIIINTTPFPLSSNTSYVPDDYTKIQWATIVTADRCLVEGFNVTGSGDNWEDAGTRVESNTAQTNNPTIPIYS
ncbi:MAG: hypothetical protein U9O85_02315, partial [Euryarchaeota archaeon]|nr:hypothetical protein [Euryarchaeota archaeon]